MRAAPTIALIGAALVAAPPAHADGGSARGAPLQDVVAAGVLGALLAALVLGLATAHRAGRISFLRRLADFGSRVSGIPGWAALPAAITGGALVLGVFGLCWDVATHIDSGRDAGPFANASHFVILAGLAGIVLGGVVAIALGREDGGGVRVRDGWRVPVGGVLIFLCGSVALLGFPLDDGWHRLFGQDVTLWGPTHIQMVAGASLSTLGVWALLVEGVRTTAAEGRRARLPVRLGLTAIAGAFVIGLSTLQLEFGFGLPQFRLLYHPVLIMLAAGIGLVAARVHLGRTGALQAAAFFAALTGLLSAAIGPGLGHTTPHFPLYLAEAAIVELVALRVSRERPLTLGALSGLGIGTVGLAAEWGWSHLWMPIPWPAALLPEAAIIGPIAALAGGVLGGFVGRALRLSPGGSQSAPRWLAPAAAAAAVLCLVYPLPSGAQPRLAARVSLAEVPAPGGRQAVVAVRPQPPGAVRGVEWFNVTAWQGGGSRLEPLRSVGEGTYRTAAPVPVHGRWKALIRLHRGNDTLGAPIYLPRDDAIPAPEVPARDGFTRPFVRDRTLLRREETGAPAGIEAVAYLLLLAIAVTWLRGVVWALRRLERGGQVARAPAPR